MGQIFQKHTQTKVPYQFLLELKGIKLRDVFDSLDIIDQQYPRALILDAEQFEDIFSGMTPLFRDLFTILSVDGYASTFETLAAVGIFSGESFESKCAFIFRLFDFDVSNTLDREEFNRTLLCVCRAMCKLSGITCPSHRQLVQLAEVCFQMMDSDRNHFIDYGEFYQWTADNEQLQEFLLQITGTQTYSHAKKRMTAMTIHLESEFMRLSKDQSQISAPSLQSFLRELYPGVNESDITLLFTIMIEYTLRMKALGMPKQSQKEIWEWRSDTEVGRNLFNQLYVKRFDFLDVMKAWTSYSTVDYNHNSTLSTSELKTLIWIYEENEPDYFRVTQVTQEVDPQRTGILSRATWMQYLCSEDAILKRVLYDSVLKKTFDKFDEAKVGILSITYVPELLKTYFGEQLRTLKDLRSVEHLYQILDLVTESIVKEIQASEVTEFTWFQFHHALISSTSEYPSLSQLLYHNKQ